ERPTYSTFSDRYNIQTNGIDQLSTDRGQGVSNLKFKMKWWTIPWKGDDQGSCDCGLALSTQVKVPVGRADNGLTSGNIDVSGLVHLGIPLFEHSGAWFTAAVTKLGPNKNMQDWPLREWSQMYELSTDWSLTDSIGFIFQARTQSPI